MGITKKLVKRRTERLAKDQPKSKKQKTAAVEDDSDDELKGLDTVDSLFASEAFAGLEDGEGGHDSDSNSSAGGFCDGDDFDDEVGDVGGLENVGAKHEEELKAIREKDPSFYKFLLEEDKNLLDFQAPEPDLEKGGDDEEGEDDNEVKDGGGSEAPKRKASGRLLTVEHFRQLRDSARSSFTAFKAVINAYHTAVRSIDGDRNGVVGEKVESDKKSTGKKRGSKKNKEPQSLFRIEDEETFSEVLEWSIGNMTGLFQHYAGVVKKGPEGKHRLTARRKAVLGHKELFDPTTYSRWPRVKVLAHIFWAETLFLLNHLVAPQMLEYVLRTSSSPEALAWLWPFQGMRNHFFRRCCSLWSQSSVHSVRLRAFLFLRNSSAIALYLPDANARPGQTPQFELRVRTVFKAFADASARGFSWRSLNTFRFMENCLCEMLRMDASTAYRVGYACIRQLALMLRDASIATSRVGVSGKKKRAKGQKSDPAGNANKKKKNAQLIQLSQGLVAWPFVRSLYLWSKAVGTIACLKPLSYPLSMIALGAAKAKLSSLQYYPFVHHCLSCLHLLGSELHMFVPTSSHLLQVLGLVLPAVEKARRVRRSRKAAKGAGVGPKAPDVDVILHFKKGEAATPLFLESVGADVMFFFFDHLGLLSRSPAFPEIAAPLGAKLKKFSSTCRSDALRNQLKSLVALVQSSSADVCGRREALKEHPHWNKFCMFKEDTALALARADAIERKAAEEKLRVEAELRGDATEKEKRELTEEPKKKRKRVKKVKKDGKATAETGDLPDQDVVEEMEFSSGSEA